MFSRGVTAVRLFSAYLGKLQPRKKNVCLASHGIHLHYQTEALFSEHVQYLYIIISKWDDESRMDQGWRNQTALHPSHMRRPFPHGLQYPKDVIDGAHVCCVWRAPLPSPVELLYAIAL